MAILSKRLRLDVARAGNQLTGGVRPRFMDVSGDILEGKDPLALLSNSRRRRSYALQASINSGRPYVFSPAPGIVTWIIGLEDQRRVHGGMIGGEVRIRGQLTCSSGKCETACPQAEALSYLVANGMHKRDAASFVKRLPVWRENRVLGVADQLFDTFYQISGWNPELMDENRLKIQQEEQISQAIEDGRQRGEQALYAFEKERMLLANIRAGDRTGARRILNDMLAAIYLSSPGLPVLRARAIELMTCLTRAAIEDNALMEPLIERNHACTEKLITADSFEMLSEVLTKALDDFMDGIYLHGVNRSSKQVRKVLDYIAENFAEKISLRDVAKFVGLSSYRVAHLVKEYTGRTVLEIIQETRIRHAEHLLERSALPCAAIAYEVGFSDQSYFTKHFRRITGTTPAAYRRGQGSGT